jgi:hypothetical protein
MKRLLILVAMLLLSGCATLVAPTSIAPAPTPVAPLPNVPPTLAAPVPTSLPSPLTSPLQSPLDSPLATPAAANPTVDLARTDLAARLKIAVAQIQVVSFEQVEWPDASMGCAKPGVMYIQVITPGYKIVLAVDGKTYEYHGKAQDAPALCQK